MIDRSRAAGAALTRRRNRVRRRAAIVTVVNGVRRLERGLRLAARQIEASTQLSAAQLFILEQLASEPAASLNALAVRTLTDRSSVSALVDRLATLGLVARQPAPEDRRRHRIHITATGRRVLAAAPPPPTAQLIAALRQLPSRELDGFARGLTRVNDILGLSALRARMLFEDGDGEEDEG